MLGIFSAKPAHQLAAAKDVRRMLADLPSQEPATALENAGIRLESLVASDEFRLDQHLEMIAGIDDAVIAQTRRLGREYLMLPGAGRGLEFKLWRANRDYWARLVAAYEDVLKRYRAGEKGADALKPQLALLCARLLQAYGGQLKWDHFRYGPIAADVWTAAGAAYQFAVESRVERKPVAFGNGGVSSSVDAEYLRVLVFQASSMDNLLPLEIEIAERLIAHLALSFKLVDHVHPENVYWIDPTKPMPPTRLARLPEITPTLRFFGTRAALVALTSLKSRMRTSDELPTDINFGGKYPLRTVLAVVEHLEACWAPVPPMRGHPRRRVKSWLTIVNGLDRIFMRLSGKTHDQSSEDEGWVVEDVSMNGIGAHVPLVGKDWLRVGALIGMRPDGGANWLLGMVRRLARESDSFGCVGLETLSKSPRAAVADSGSMRVEVIVLDALKGSDRVRVAMVDYAWDKRIPLLLTLDGLRVRLHPIDVADSGEGFVIGSYQAESI